ncbi:unnamed protein product, partial [marine sediment metagenome]
MKPAGYLTNHKEGLAGEPGLFYNYVLADNGLFIEAENNLLRASVRIADVRVRGLEPKEDRVELIRGKIPPYLYDLALSVLFVDRYKERYLSITWDGGYRIWDSSQETSECSVKYSNLPSTVMDIHSHGSMWAHFSYVDDQDEQGLRLSMVVGRLDTMIPDVSVRI